MMKKLLILGMLVTSLFGGVRELDDENFDKATRRGLVVVEFWASWNEANKVTVLDDWDNFDAKIYRVNIDLYPKIQADNEVVILPTIIIFDDGKEVKRLQGDMSFSLEVTKKQVDKIVDEILMPNKKAKDKKMWKKRLNQWLNKYGRTAKQIKKYKKKHGKDNIPSMPKL